MASPKVAIIGYGYVGKAYHKMFPDAVIYDEPQNLVMGELFENDYSGGYDPGDFDIDKARKLVNSCDLAIVCVPTNSLSVPVYGGIKSQDFYNGDNNPAPEVVSELDMSIVKEVVGWLETPLILIKSALQPGTVDRLVKKTGKKIAVSVEFIGQGSYFIPPQYPNPDDPRKHPMLIVGGDEDTATKCTEILWQKMSPTTRIHIVTALEAEITKLVENAYGALKVTWINSLMSLTQKVGASFIKVHQAWTADPRVDGMHQRAVSFKRGWSSHCWDKDVMALMTYADSVGAEDMAKLIDTIITLNAEHLNG